MWKDSNLVLKCIHFFVTMIPCYTVYLCWEHGNDCLSVAAKLCKTLLDILWSATGINHPISPVWSWCRTCLNPPHLESTSPKSANTITHLSLIVIAAITLLSCLVINAALLTTTKACGCGFAPFTVGAQLSTTTFWTYRRTICAGICARARWSISLVPRRD